MALPERVSKNRIRIPLRAEGPGGVIGDGSTVIGPDHPQWQMWDDYLNGQPSPEK